MVDSTVNVYGNTTVTVNTYLTLNEFYYYPWK